MSHKTKQITLCCQQAPLPGKRFEYNVQKEQRKNKEAKIPQLLNQLHNVDDIVEASREDRSKMHVTEPTYTKFSNKQQFHAVTTINSEISQPSVQVNWNDLKKKTKLKEEPLTSQTQVKSSNSASTNVTSSFKDTAKDAMDLFDQLF